MKKQDKTPEKQWNGVEIGKFPEKEFKRNDSEDDPGYQKQNGEVTRKICRWLRRTKEQMNRDEQCTERSQCQYNWCRRMIKWHGSRMVEITAAKWTIEKRMKRNEDSLRSLGLHKTHQHSHYRGLRRRRGFPSGSGGRDSTCKAGDLGLIPGSGGSSGERNGYTFHYSHL